MASLPVYSSPVHNISTTSITSAPPSYQANSNDVTLDFSPLHRFSAISPSENASSRPSSSHSSRVSFTIGRKQTLALVTPVDLKAHLVILSAFHRLREDVYSATRSMQSSAGDADLQPAWEVFLARAVWRFELWLKYVVARPIRESLYGGPVNTWLNPHEIPPIDVVMVWHSYLLHPRTYFEDGLRYNTGLLSRGSFPLHEIATMIEKGDPLRPGSLAQTRAYYWESCTQQPWQLPPSLERKGTDFITINCPACTSDIRAPWVSEGNTGWAQKQFRASCPNCGMQVSKETLSVLKFSEDLRRVVEEPKRRTLATLHLHEETGKPFIAAALLFNQNLVEDLEKSSFQPDARSYAAHELRWSADKVAARCRAGFRTTAYMKQYKEDGKAHQGLKGLQRIMEAYTTPGPYSIDLVRAVQRQMKFVDSMVGISWTDIGKFDSDSNELALKRAIAGYHAFLDIMAQNPDAFLVPTLSIDLAWHTHQLLCVNYRETTLDLVGTIVDHDDSVEQETLAAAFDQTARLWSSRFSVPYSTCGCPTARYTKSSAMDSMTKLFSKKGKQKAAPTEVENHRPDLICHHPNHVYETHPSDHSQVKVINSSSIAKQVAAREKLNKRRVEEDQGAVASGTADGWQGLAVRMRNDRGNGHDPAFSNLLSPDEILNAKAIPMGQCTMTRPQLRSQPLPSPHVALDQALSVTSKPSNSLNRITGMALKAVKALGKALKRGIPVERRKLRKYSWLPDVLRIEGSIIRRVVGPVFTVTLFAAGVVVCSEVYDYHLNLSNNVVPLLSVVVGLILVFRNTTSYDRYYEGRKDFAALTSIVRNLSRLIWVQVVMPTEMKGDGEKTAPSTFAFLRAGSPSPKSMPGSKPTNELTAAELTAQKIRAIKLLLSFVYAVMHHLRDEPGTDYEDYEGVLPQGFKYDAKELGIDRNSLLKKYATYSAMDRGHLGYAPKTRFRRHSSFKGFMGSNDAPKATNAPSSRTPLLEGDHATVEGSHATVEFHPRSTPASLPLPLIIAHDLQRILYSFKRKGLLDPLGPAGFNAMNQFVCSMVELLTAMERIATTPIPISYGIHLKQCVTLYLFSLPFTLMHDMHWKTIPLVTLVAFTLMGIEGIANELEMPFGKKSADLPLQQYCEALRSEIEYMVERLPEGPEDDDPYEEEEDDD